MHPEEGLNFPDKYHGQDIDKVGNIDLTNPENWRKAHPMGFTAKPEIVNPRTHSDFLDKEDKFLLNAFSDGGEVRIINDKVVYRGADNKTTTIGTIRVVDGDKRIYKSPFAKAFIKEDTDELVENWAKENGYSVWKEDFGSSYEGGGYIVQDSWKESGIGNLSIQQTKKVAEKYAKALSIADNEVYSVNPSVEENSFDLDVEGDEYGGGSYLIYGDGSVVNVAITPNARYGSISSSVDEIISKVLNIEMQRENAEYKDRIRWDGSVSGKEIVSEIKYEGGGEITHNEWKSILSKFLNEFYGDYEEDTWEDYIDSNSITSNQTKYKSGGYDWSGRPSAYDREVSFEEAYNTFNSALTPKERKGIKVSFDGGEYADAEAHDTDKNWQEITITKVGSSYEGGGSPENENEVYIEFLNKEKNFTKDRKSFKTYEDAVKWARENFDKFNPDMIHYYSGGGGIKQSMVYDIDGTEYLVHEPIQDIKGNYSGWTCYKAVFETKNGERHLNYERTKTIGNRKWFSNEHILKGKIVEDYYSGGGSTVKPLPADIIKHKDLMNRSDYTAYVKINDYPYTATVRKLNSFKEHLNRKDEKFTPNVFGEITYISDNASDEWVYQLQKLIDEKKKELQTYYNGGMTRNEHILESFLTSNKNANVNNLSTHYAENENQILLRNYGTLIALRRGNDVKITSKKYSKTTSTIQNALERMAKNMGMNVSRVDEFDAGGQLSEVSDMLPHSEPMGVIQPMNIMETVQPMYSVGGKITFKKTNDPPQDGNYWYGVYNNGLPVMKRGEHLRYNAKNIEHAERIYQADKRREILAIQQEQLDGWKEILKPEVYDALEEYAKRDNDTVKNPYNITRGQELSTYIGNYMLGHRFDNGGQLSEISDMLPHSEPMSVIQPMAWGGGISKHDELVFDAYNKALDGKVNTDSKEQFAESLNKPYAFKKYSKKAIDEAWDIFTTQPRPYAGGGGLENKRGYSKMDSFINEDGEEIALYWHSAYDHDEMVISKNGDIWKRYLLPEDESKAKHLFNQWKNHSENKKSEEKRKEMLKSIFNALEEQIKYQDKTPAISIEQSIMLRDIMRNDYGFAGGGSVEKKLRNNRQLVPSREILDKEEYNDFIKYVHRWSADKTRSQVKEAINRYIIALDNQNFSSWGGGDTIDRERAMVFLENPKLKTLPNLAEGGGVGKTNGDKNREWLSNQTQDYTDRILQSIADYYGTSKANIKDEVFDEDAEMLYEYIGNNNSLRRNVYDSMIRKYPNYAGGGGVEEKKQMSRTVLNDAVKKLIKNNGTDINKYSEYDLNTLKSFVSPRDLTEEMCQKIWGLAIENGFEGYQSKVIVFNSGTGKLLNYVDNEFARVDAINPDKDENVVATLLNNKDVINVHTDSLKTLNRYNLAIINNKQKSELTDLKLVTNKLNSNNLLIFVSPMNCLNNETIKSFINDNYDLLDAYCVEEGYYHNGAVIEGSIISVLKKL